MFIAIRKQEMGMPLNKLLETMDTTTTTVLASKSKSSIRRVLVLRKLDLDDWDILEIKRKKGVAIEQ